jgi:hypothetical protein
MWDACRKGRFAQNISISLVKFDKFGVKMEKRVGLEEGSCCVGGVVG